MKKNGKKRIERIEVDMGELEEILERSASGPLDGADRAKLQAAMETLAFLTQELEKKRVSVGRLKELLFGATTEKTKKVLERVLEASAKEGTKDAPGDTEGIRGKGKRKGHGRNGADAYAGAEKVRVGHGSLGPGNPCPDCAKGKVYLWTPGRIVRIRGQAPLGATVYELQKLRCNLCGEVFTAEAPEGVGEEKYDAESGSMIALLKYGTGLPFHRLERLQGSLGIPLPAATQWEIVEEISRRIGAVFEELVRQAAQGEVVHNDDTTMKVLGLGVSKTAKEGERKGIFTSGIVSRVGEREVALFFTGGKHAGENLTDLLKRRASDRGPPIQMCDALSRNMPDKLEAIVANCLAHARRKFVDVAANFPEECLHVLQILKQVYKNDVTARKKAMSAEERLGFHKAESGPLLEDLEVWMTTEIDEGRVEPNSGLGEAIGYMRKHWKRLTLFLREAGAPLDNNICERALKKVILHRKNAYFYKTQNGARVGDLFMSLIHTCELNGANPFDYLTQLQKHASQATSAPAAWMPWNYRSALDAGEAPGSG